MKKLRTQIKQNKNKKNKMIIKLIEMLKIQLRLNMKKEFDRQALYIYCAKY